MRVRGRAILRLLLEVGRSVLLLLGWGGVVVVFLGRSVLLLLGWCVVLLLLLLLLLRGSVLLLLLRLGRVGLLPGGCMLLLVGRVGFIGDAEVFVGFLFLVVFVAFVGGVGEHFE